MSGFRFREIFKQNYEETCSLFSQTNIYLINNFTETSRNKEGVGVACEKFFLSELFCISCYYAIKDKRYKKTW